MLLGAVLEEEVGDDAAVDVVAPTLVEGTRLLLGDGHLVQNVAAGATEPFGHGGAEESQVARRQPEVAVDEVLLAPLGHRRHGFTDEELASHVAERLQLVGHPRRHVVSGHEGPLLDDTASRLAVVESVS